MSPVRWLRAFAVLGATALLLASSCTWQLGLYIPKGVPPPPGDHGAVFRLVLPIRVDPAARTERISRFATGPPPAAGPALSELSGQPETWQ